MGDKMQFTFNSHATAVLASCSLFMLAGPILVLVNRQILKETEFKYPMCVSGLGVLCTSIFAHLLVDVLKVAEIKKNHDSSFFLKSCLPVGACQVSSFSPYHDSR